MWPFTPNVQGAFVRALSKSGATYFPYILHVMKTKFWRAIIFGPRKPENAYKRRTKQHKIYENKAYSLNFNQQQATTCPFCTFIVVFSQKNGSYLSNILICNILSMFGWFLALARLTRAKFCGSCALIVRMLWMFGSTAHALI